MNRQQRRRLEGVDKRGPKPEPDLPTQRASIELRLHKSALRPGVVRTAFTVVGKTDFELWANIVGEALARMGYTQPKLAIGMVLDMVNQWPTEFRQLTVVGLVKGLGLQVTVQKALVCDKCGATALDPREFKHTELDGADLERCTGKPEERELLQGQLDPTYQPLPPPAEQKDDGMRRTASGLLLP